MNRYLKDTAVHSNMEKDKATERKEIKTEKRCKSGYAREPPDHAASRGHYLPDLA